eukprot:TRINITY_DN2331_c0_g1_i1.p1 TRINITY_DN2331_c0_g1~~TRINITY_DN2331_c0_g1_i1.p1  ORF type:complete len:287 (+),score=64.25 TRINITY_DN2331_c0_g1_i1:67-927(+)
MSMHMPVKVNGPNTTVTQPYYGTANTAGMVMNTQVANPPAQQANVQAQNPHQAYIQKFTLSVLDLLASTQTYIKNSKQTENRSSEAFAELAQKYESFEGYCDDLYSVVETSKQKYLQRNNTMDQSNQMQFEKLAQLRQSMRRMDNALNGIPSSGETPLGNSMPSLTNEVNTPTGGVSTPYNATGSAVNTPIALSASSYGITAPGGTPTLGTPMSSLHSPLLKPSPGDPGDGSQVMASSEPNDSQSMADVTDPNGVGSQSQMMPDDPMGLDSLDDLGGPINVEDFLV